VETDLAVIAAAGAPAPTRALSPSARALRLGGSHRQLTLSCASNAHNRRPPSLRQPRRHPHLPDRGAGPDRGGFTHGHGPPVDARPSDHQPRRLVLLPRTSSRGDRGRVK